MNIIIAISIPFLLVIAAFIYDKYIREDKGPSYLKYFPPPIKISEERKRKNEEFLKKQEEKMIKLKMDYDFALESKNKAEALKKGREYYSYLRSEYYDDDRGPSIYDETAIANDLAAIDVKDN